MGIDILGIDILGVDILGIDIPAPTPFYDLHIQHFVTILMGGVLRDFTRL